MKLSLSMIAALLALTAGTVTANAVEFGVGPGGVYVGPGYHEGWRHHRYDGDCRVTRERVITPSGREIFRTHRVCD